ncbi:DUF3197 domain-containing protein [Deinococcus budaensis]|uniref:DUF3197 domain-containing protein n=1 Tax=Deinococcus budaensis TaxID=1665626 RepID=A0A7W8LQJ0_9DEIO|nr:DUF3197 domain-containing protein [Deinococcus budaensis]MBB5234918.1 hypothetical protein [Deinococcus budaensis]
MHILDPLGLPGAPLETQRDLLAHLGAEARAGGGTLTLITDGQGVRTAARYAALVTRGDEALLTAAAFGPAYGEAGRQALADLARLAQARGWPLRETVLNPSDFVRVLAEPDAAEIARLIAASNPSDPAIYTAQPKVKPREDAWED